MSSDSIDSILADMADLSAPADAVNPYALVGLSGNGLRRD